MKSFLKCLSFVFLLFIFSHSFGEQFSKRKWLREMVGQRELISAFAGVPIQEVRGMRAPFLAVK
jgi:hypothetical protein